MAWWTEIHHLVTIVYLLSSFSPVKTSFLHCIQLLQRYTYAFVPIRDFLQRDFVSISLYDFFLFFITVLLHEGALQLSSTSETATATHYNLFWVKIGEIILLSKFVSVLRIVLSLNLSPPPLSHSVDV